VKSSRIVQNVFRRASSCIGYVSQIQDTLKAFYGAEAADSGDMAICSRPGAGRGRRRGGSDDDVSAAADNELVKLVNKVIIDATTRGVGYPHRALPRQGQNRDPAEKDGSLFLHRVPGSYRNAMVARIKIMCDLDISEKRKPRRKINSRNSGADIELRVDDPFAGRRRGRGHAYSRAGEPIRSTSWACRPRTCEAQGNGEQALRSVFVCGPTGSARRRRCTRSRFSQYPDTKIWTAEDPGRNHAEGLAQVQVKQEGRPRFRGRDEIVLRADPDIIMVGEMRDKKPPHGYRASLTATSYSPRCIRTRPESIIRCSTWHGSLQLRRRVLGSSRSGCQASVREMQAGLRAAATR